MRTSILYRMMHSNRYQGAKEFLLRRLTRATQAAAGAAVLAGGLTFVGCAQPAAAVEQLTNGSFETNNGFNADNSGLGWETVEGTDTTLGFDVYSHTSQVYYSGAPPTGAGEWYFHSVGLGSLGSTPAVVEQVADVSGLVGQNFRFSAYISGFSAPGDTATLELSYWDAVGGASGSGNQLGDTVVLDGATGGDDGISDTWDFFTDIGQVPSGAVSASVRILQATAAGSNGNDNYVDLVSLDVFPESLSILNLEVNKVSGAARIQMPGDAIEGARAINFYEITAASDSLNPNWTSLSDLNLDPVDGPDADSTVGNSGGETWDEGGGSTASLLTEAFLLGSTNFAPGDSQTMTNVYTGGALGAEDLVFRYLVDGSLFEGTVSYVSDPVGPGDADGDGNVDGNDFLLTQRNNPAGIPIFEDNFGNGIPATAAAGAVPEPASTILAGFGLGRLALTRRRRT